MSTDDDATATRRRAPRRRIADGERASVTVWLLGVAVMVLFLAGFAVDLWQATAQRRALAGVADAAATAGAAALDQEAFRASGEVRLRPGEARRRAAAIVAARANADQLSVTAVSIDATADGITVSVAGEIDVTLLRVLRPGAGPWPVEVRSTAQPRVDDVDAAAAVTVPAANRAASRAAAAPARRSGTAAVEVHHVGAVDEHVQRAALAVVVAPLVQRVGAQRAAVQLGAHARDHVVGQPAGEVVDGLVEHPHALHAALP